jgi:uracil-DNA glycosylase
VPDNASELLRRYLEQRRDAGETELVLDGMTVEEVMRIVGARADVAGARPDVAPAPMPREAPVAPPAPVANADARSAPRTEIDVVAGAPIIVGKAGRDLFAGPLAKLTTLEEIAAHAAACTRCPLGATATNCVPGEGSAQAKLMCVGEAPGEQEDLSGRPFVGKAGQLLTKILAAIDLKREDVFICNVLKHRPPGNRNPLPDEVTACSPYLVRQIELIQPRVILAFGTFAAQTLLETKLSISKLRGTVHQYHGVPLIVTYHPAALLRNPAWKRPTWDDVQHARRLLDRPGS